MTSVKLNAKIQKKARIPERMHKKQLEAVIEAIENMERFAQRNWEIFIRPGEICDEAVEYIYERGFILNEYFSTYIIQIGDR